ncbi:MAG: hypothetical protein R3190_19145, partial [Thermoanaerobaculia bacterium]|nr:hypothetical protein [Thermoanaerobaculia bacterium]
MASLRRLLRYVRPYAPSLCLAVLLISLTGALASLGVAAMNPLVNEVLLPAGGAAEPNLSSWLGDY